jgi:hypothetical protein
MRDAWYSWDPYYRNALQCADALAEAVRAWLEEECAGHPITPEEVNAEKTLRAYLEARSG